MESAFENKYSVEVPKLEFGLNTETFHIDRSFFEAFEFSPIQEGSIQAKVEITKYRKHLDAQFHFTGWVTLHCDRCMEPYPHAVDFRQRIVYSFDATLEFDTDEVVMVDESEPVIHFATDFYDFIVLDMPLRKVPEPSVHLCAPEVLDLLGLNPDGSEKPEAPAEEEEENIDPRWAALKKLKQDEDETSKQ